MAHRFFISEIPAGDQATLVGDQAHHAAQVMRFEIDDQIVLFDGQGQQADCKILEISKKRVEVEILDRSTDDRALATSIALAVALPKSDRQKFLVEKLVELGVQHLVPLIAQRNVAVVNEKVISRIKKQIIEASKQCERNLLMTVQPPMDFQAVQQWAQRQAETRLWIADPDAGQAIADVLRDQPSNRGGGKELVAIGPEGGFTDGELATASGLGFEKLRIGPTILRVETAAIATAAIFGPGQA